MQYHSIEFTDEVRKANELTNQIKAMELILLNAQKLQQVFSSRDLSDSDETSSSKSQNMEASYSIQICLDEPNRHQIDTNKPDTESVKSEELTVNK